MIWRFWMAMDLSLDINDRPCVELQLALSLLITMQTNSEGETEDKYNGMLFFIANPQLLDTMMVWFAFQPPIHSK